MNINKLIPLLSEMAIFAKVAEYGSFSKAAASLGLAPSSVSRSVTRLEDALQQKLLERNTRQMRLSAPGHQVYELCNDMLSAANMAVSAAQSDKKEISGSLCIAAPKALSKQVLMPIVLDFAEANPAVALHFKVDDRYLDPVADGTDIVIQITDKPIEGLISKKLGHCRLVLCASPDYLQKNSTPKHPDDFSRHNCLRMGESPRDSVWEFTNQKDKISVDVKSTFAVNHSEIRREAVLRGFGISIFPEFAIAPYIKSEEVIEVLPDWQVGGNYQGNIVAQYTQSKYIPNQITAFVEYVREQIQLDTRFFSNSD